MGGGPNFASKIELSFIYIFYENFILLNGMIENSFISVMVFYMYKKPKTKKSPLHDLCISCPSKCDFGSHRNRQIGCDPGSLGVDIIKEERRPM